MKRGILLLIGDILIVVLSFALVAWLKQVPKIAILQDYFKPFFYSLVLWLLASVLSKKYYFSNFYHLKKSISAILLSNLVAVAAMFMMMYIFRTFDFSRLLTFGTILSATVLEFTGAIIFNSILKSPVISEGGEESYSYDNNGQRVLHDSHRIGRIFKNQNSTSIAIELLKIIEKEQGKEVRKFIENYTQAIGESIQVVSTTNRVNVLFLPQEKYGCIVNLHRINDIQYINKFFEAVNSKIETGALFIGRAETASLRKKRILKKYFFPLNYIIYIIDFIFKRIFPKIPILKRIYFLFTGGQNRLLSRAETLGRLYSCGFEVVEECYLNDYLYFVVRKKSEPHYPATPTYGPLIRLNRIGKGGKLIKVYKMRTMHPYAEYLQPYIYAINDLQEGGKFKDDFRVTTLGKIMRKVWLDELPMLINILKGDMKIVGVRPLSKHYYSLYSKELQEKRIKFRPGLVPPFYADMPKTMEEIMESELKYLDAYAKSPFTTDFKYFIAAWKNILFKRARSN